MVHRAQVWFHNTGTASVGLSEFEWKKRVVRIVQNPSH